MYELIQLLDIVSGEMKGTLTHKHCTLLSNKRSELLIEATVTQTQTLAAPHKVTGMIK